MSKTHQTKCLGHFTRRSCHSIPSPVIMVMWVGRVGVSDCVMCCVGRRLLFVVWVVGCGLSFVMWVVVSLFVVLVDM
jgi:hypothetical protein